MTDFSIADAIKNREQRTSDGGYLIPNEVLDEPCYIPLWSNWFGCLLMRWFKIRSQETSLREMFFGDEKDD